MSSLLGTLVNSATNPPPKNFFRKRKPLPVEDSDQEPPSTDDAFSSPVKRPRVDDDSAMPATEQLANLDVYSSSEDFDMSTDDIDMDAFMDMDDDRTLRPLQRRKKPIL